MRWMIVLAVLLIGLGVVSPAVSACSVWDPCEFGEDCADHYRTCIAQKVDIKATP